MVDRSRRHVLALAAGTALAQCVTALAIPAITRLYSPEAYATWALILGILVIIATVANLRFDLAIVLPKTNEEAASVFNLAVACSATLMLVTLGLALVVPTFSQFVLGFRQHTGLILWSCALIGMMGLNQACLLWCVRRSYFYTQAASSLVQSLATAGIQIGAAMAGYADAVALLAGTILGQFAGTALILVRVLAADGRYFKAAASRDMLWSAAKTYKSYPLFMTPYTLVGVLRNRVNLYFLDYHGSRVQVGYFAFAQRICDMPVSLVSSALRSVVYRKAAQGDVKSLEGTIYDILRTMGLVIIPFWMLAMVEAPELIRLVFGDKWQEASYFVVVLSFPGFALLLTNWLDRLFDALGRQRLAFFLELGFSALSIASFAVGLGIWRSVELAAKIQAVVVSIYYAIWLTVLWKAADFKMKLLFQLLTTLLGTSFVAIALLWVLQKALPSTVFWIPYALLCLVSSLFLGRRFLKKYRSS